ncbi:RNA polymerase sigma factor [Falsiroseomonas sp.]|uniref:RNA polymerase sigma factor n=1 Tax=Falsiroseomonas sp. TaxID=2870721 RepID=UPI003F6EE18F
MTPAQQAAEQAARAAYGRLVARLAARSRDIAGAEDALAEAFAAALRHWPQRGVPASPEAWLLTVARNAQRNAGRHRRVREAAVPELELRQAELAAPGADWPDERLKLLFVCAHPAIDPGIRTPLMLQVVLGLDAARIASALLLAPAAMSQRLVRAKAKIRDAGLRFELPEREEMPGRLGAVVEAVYAAYGTGWEGAGPRGLAEEAMALGRLLVEALPGEPEAKGLLALMLHCEARRGARRDAEGRFVPLARQDPRRWSRDLMAEAERLLVEGARAGRFGRFLCEAAIQSVHAQRAATGRTDHAALRLLYDLLAEQAPSLGVLTARAAALLEAGDIRAAEAALAALPAERVAAYQPYWATRAALLRCQGRDAEEAAARQRAIGLTEDPAIRDFLRDG